MSAANEAFEKSIMAEAGTSAQTWFKRFMWAGIAANLLVGLSLICWPASVLSIFHLAEPYPLIWPRHSGLVLCGMSLFYIPAAIAPLGYLYNAMLAVLARFLGILFFLIAWDVYIWFAVFDSVFAIPQAILLWRTWRDDLMSKP